MFLTAVHLHHLETVLLLVTTDEESIFKFILLKCQWVAVNLLDGTKRLGQTEQVADILKLLPFLYLPFKKECSSIKNRPDNLQFLVLSLPGKVSGP